MRKECFAKDKIKNIMESRAARGFAVSVSVFLCILTLFEFVALRMEWNVPALGALAGDNGFWSEEMQQEELALDDSTENELLDETEALLAGENAKKQPDGNMPAAPEKEVTKNWEVTHDEPSAFPYYIKINRKQNCITVYTMDADGTYTVPYKAMICSTGLYNATPRGTFQISTKYFWRELYGGVYGQYATRIHGGVLFHSVPYYRKSKSTLCTSKYNKLGQQASMGCVRLTVEDAKWIVENCPEGTTVEIYDDDDPGPLGKPEAAHIDADDPNRNWDPTDPDADNPWNAEE